MNSPPEEKRYYSGSKKKIPGHFLCQLTKELMDDPAVTPCGHLFDRSSLTQYFVGKQADDHKCPECHQKISETMLYACLPLKYAINEFKENGRSGSIFDSGKLLASINKKLFSSSNKDKEKDDKSDKSPSTSPRSSNRKSVEDREREKVMMEKAKHSSRKSSASFRNSGTRPPLRVWGRLVSLKNESFYQDIGYDEFLIGRAKYCDFVQTVTEISNVHCVITRAKRDNSNEYDYFLEDKSTNGTFLNETRLTKGEMVVLNDGDEISMCERLSSRIFPTAATFIDQILGPLNLSPEQKDELSKLKLMPSVFAVLECDAEAFKSMGIYSSVILEKLLSSSKVWRDRFSFPAFRFEVGTGSSHGNRSSRATRSSTSQQGKVSSVPEDDNFDDISEIFFEPTEYLVNDGDGVAVLNVRRLPSHSVIKVLVRSSEANSNPPPGSPLYQKFEKIVTFLGNETLQKVEFYWKVEQIQGESAKIAFDLFILSGKGMIGQHGHAYLTIRPSRSQRCVSRIQNDMSLSDYNASFGPKDQLIKPDFKYDDILITLMDNFPNLSSKAILECIKKEHASLSPNEGREVLTDKCIAALSKVAKRRSRSRSIAKNKNYKYLTIPNAVDKQQALQDFELNPQKHPNFDDEKDTSESYQLEHASHSPPLESISELNKQTTSEVAESGDISLHSTIMPQTILRSELKSFTLMASLSIFRKFFCVDEYLYTHFRSPIIKISTSFADKFLQLIRNLEPSEKNPMNSANDIFLFDHVVDRFKKFVTDSTGLIAEEAKSLLQDEIPGGYRYSVSFHKSIHHPRMENNHAVIEDMNTLFNLDPTCPFTSFYGVFDGHGTHLISEYLSLHLAYNISRHPEFSTDISKAIYDTFIETDSIILDKGRRDRLKGGSTCVSAFIRNNSVYVGWAGDARCILFKRVSGNLIAYPLIVPHNPLGSEKARVVKAGGFLEYVAGKWRVNGRLAVTRSFGDEALKPIITAEPEIQEYNFSGEEEFLLLSCDGLYDVMEYADIAEFLDEKIKSGMEFEKLVDSLIQEGLKRKSTDDITVLLVDLANKE